MTDITAHEKYAVARYAIRTAQDLLYDARFNVADNPALRDKINDDISCLDDTLVSLRKIMEGWQ